MQDGVQDSYKILVVDDEPDLEPLILQRMRRNIRSGRYSFVFAGNGIEALERLTTDSEIDMVISDINMPQMDGLTLLEQIPKVDPNIRSVIISAYGDMRNIRTAMNRGAFDFVTKPLDFEDLQITIDRTLSHMAEWREALESRDKLVALQNELDVASKMQQSILPTSFPTTAEFEVYGNMVPARNVGGDFFDLIPMENGRLGLSVADVSDKGVPAALFMMSSRTLLKGSAIGMGAPGNVLSEVNTLLTENNDTMMFVTLVYALYEPETGTLTYANGGHCNPLVVHPNGSSTELALTGGVALGVMPDLEYREDSTTLNPGETLVLYTDGVSEAMNGEGEEFGVERLQQLFANQPPTSAKMATEAIMQAVSDFAGGTPQSDDVTCLVLRRAPR